MASVPKTQAPVVVATAGSRVPLSGTPKFARSVRVVADTTNTGNIFVGDRNVSSTQYSDKLAAGQAVDFDEGLFDLSRIYVDADTNGSKAQVTHIPA